MRARLLISLLALAVPSVAGADQKSLVDLLNRVPEAPATAQEAAKWFDKEGHLVHPGILALKADLEANKKVGEVSSAKDGANAQALAIQGMESVGIDVARMQKDPAYAKEMQEKLKKMSPAEQMAFVQKMTQPQRQSSLTDVKAMASETPAVDAAVDAAKGWNEAMQARIKTQIAERTETEKTAQRVAYKPIAMARPKIEFDSPGCDKSCDAQWRAYGEKLWPVVLDREADILQIRRTALQRDRADLTRLMQDGDRLLAPTQYGAGAKSQVNRTWLTGYHQSLIGEIDQLIEQTQTAAKRAADVVNNGVERLFWASANR
ncbi:MAG TPA: hypothetical protein VH497_04800 [Vicinamibacterales bacterium]